MKEKLKVIPCFTFCFFVALNTVINYLVSNALHPNTANTSMWVTWLYQYGCTRIEMIDLTIFSQQTIDLGWLYKAQGDEGTLLAWGMMGYHKDAEQLP